MTPLSGPEIAVRAVRFVRPALHLVRVGQLKKYLFDKQIPGSTDLSTTHSGTQFPAVLAEAMVDGRLSVAV